MHLYNPAWPPHVKLHNGQTMLLGIMLGTLALVILFGVEPLTLPMFLLAAAIAGAYFIAMMFAPFFPGTAWADPEFREQAPKPFGITPQQLVTYLLCALLAGAMAIACLEGHDHRASIERCRYKWPCGRSPDRADVPRTLVAPRVH